VYGETAVSSRPSHQNRPAGDRLAGLMTPFLNKLRACVKLLPADEEALLDAIVDIRDLAAGEHLIRKGDRPEYVHILLNGWAARYEIVADGGRAITAFLLPGDLCDQHVTVLGKMDHSIVTLTTATVAFLRNGHLEAIAVKHPSLSRSLWWSTLVDEAILRAWLVNIGRRSAFEAIGHLLCELHIRISKAGLTENSDFALPLTQDDIGDALGLTPVHVNRMLQRLRKEGFITLQRGMLVITDVARLEDATDFDESYLHSSPVDLIQLMG
jgi:CRP-like cAMP-binding protein